MHYKHINRGTCSTEINYDIIDGRVRNVAFTGGCNGNLKTISILIDGLTPEEIIKKCRGIKCGMKQTSCADQLADAMEKVIEKENKNERK